MAFFYESDWGNTAVTLSGKVDIVAVGSDGSSIEDTATSSGLIMYLHDGYNVLIPGGEVTAIANCKVMPSTTQPLLRAEFNIYLVDKNGTAMNISDDVSNLSGNLFYELNNIVSNNNWYKYTDGYYYYIGDNALQSPRKNTILKEVGSLTEEVVVSFLDKSFKFPTFVTSYYSGWGVKLEVRFEAIQDYIPDAAGNKLTNTIQNSLNVFRNQAPGAITEPNVIVSFDASNNPIITAGSDGVIPKQVVLPETDANGNSITTLTKSMADSLTSVGVEEIVLPSSITSIEKSAFKGNTVIKSVDLSETLLTSIPHYAFQDCSNLVSVQLPETITSLGYNCFSNCGLIEINLPDGITTINRNALVLNYITSIYIPASVTYLDFMALYSDYLKTIIVSPENEKYIALNNQSLIDNDTGLLLYLPPASLLDPQGNPMDYYMPECVTGITNSYTLLNCKIKTLYLAKNYVDILGIINYVALFVDGYDTYNGGDEAYTIMDDGQSVYYGDKLVLVNRFNYSGSEEFCVKEGTQRIELGAFAKMTRITTLKIPVSIKVMDRCMSHAALKFVYFYGENPPEYLNDTNKGFEFLYGNTYTDVVIYVPAESVSLYKSQSWMGEYADNVVTMP